jgi:hypothetical protein
MTGLYLDKLRALKSQKGAVEALPKLTKRSPPVEVAPPTTADGGFGSFDSTQRAGLSNFPAPYSRTIAALEAGCPELVPVDRWQLAVEDGRRFLARWGDQAHALGWTAKDLFGLLAVPEHAKPSFNRLSRYDEIGLIWLLEGRRVIALAEATAAIRGPTAAITVYRRHNKPALAPPRRQLGRLHRLRTSTSRRPKEPEKK